MGAEYFQNTAWVDDIKIAFSQKVWESQYNYGHAGYTGTIAEKNQYELRSTTVFTSHKEAESFADKDIASHDHDKWGPAWVVAINDPIKGKGWLFYGYASS